MNQSLKNILYWAFRIVVIIDLIASILLFNLYFNKDNSAVKNSLADQKLQNNHDLLLKRIDTLNIIKQHDSLMTIQFVQEKEKQDLINKNLIKINNEKINIIKSLTPDSLDIFAGSIKQRRYRQHL